MKKFLSLLLTLALVVALCPLSVSAADNVPKMTVKKTDIKADYVSNVDGYGNLSLDVVFGDELIPLPKIALIDKTGKVLFDYRESYYNYYYDPDSEIISFTTYFPYLDRDYHAQYYGEEAVANIYPIFYNADGSVAFSLPPSGNTHYDAGPMRNGRAVVVESTKSGGDVEYSLYVVDKTGKKVLTFPDAAAEPDSEGYVVWKKEIYSFSDGLAHYRETIPYEFPYGFGWLMTKDVYLDTNGEVVLDFTERGFNTYDFSDGLARADRFEDGRICFIDKTGEVVFSLDPETVAQSFSHGLAYVETPEQAGYIDKTGKMVITSDYDFDYVAGDGLLTVINNGKCGLMNTKNEVVVPLEYDSMSTYENGVAYAVKDGCVYIITADEGASTTPETPTDTGFADVPADAWYAASVAWAVEKEITNGTSVDKFSPNKTCNTAEILTFLWRACGKPAGGSAGSFTDVADSAWYADAAAWAKSKGMVSGSTLSPDTPCTRASAVMFIWQACGKPAASETASFSDVPADADYAAAVAWAVEKGVTNGTGADTFSPDTICNRGHIVTFLQRAFAE